MLYPDGFSENALIYNKVESDRSKQANIKYDWEKYTRDIIVLERPSQMPEWIATKLRLATYGA